MYIFIDEAGGLGFQFTRLRRCTLWSGVCYSPRPATRTASMVSRILLSAQEVGEEKHPKSEVLPSREGVIAPISCLSWLTWGRFGIIYVDKRRALPYLRESSKINYVYNQMVCYLLENVIKSADRRREYLRI